MRTHADLVRARGAVALVHGELVKAGRTEAASGLATALDVVDAALALPLAPEAPTAPALPSARASRPAPISPASAPVAGSGGPSAGRNEVPMAPPPSATVGSCPDCGGQLRHAPTCPRVAPAAKGTA